MEKIKRDLSEKMMLQNQIKRKKGEDKKNRSLISINVLGSAGPRRFLVNGDDLVSGVIDTALKTYARERRLPVLSSAVNNFVLYCTNTAAALNPWDAIGSQEGRSFVLCKTQTLQPQMTEVRSSDITTKKPSGWKAWINKSLTFKILTSH